MIPIRPNGRKKGLDYPLVQTVGADSISAPTQYVAEKMINAGKK